MDELPGILLIGAGFGAIVFAGLLARLFARRVREHLRKRRSVRRHARSEIASALTEAAPPLGECEALLIQLGIKRELLSERRTESLVKTKHIFDQSIYALYAKKEALIFEHRRLKRESDAVYLHRRTRELEQLSTQSKDLILRALQLKRNMAELHAKLLTETRAAPLNVATESRRINAEIDAALAGPIDALRVKHGVQGKRMYRALYPVTRAREIYATLPAPFWNPDTALEPADLQATDVDAADVVNRHYGKHARTAIQRMSDWLSSIQSISAIHAKALAAYNAGLTSVKATLETHPDQTIAAEWATQQCTLADIASQLSHVELEELDTRTQQARECEARIRVINELAASVNHTAAAARRINTTAAFRDEQWRDAALRVARRLKELEPGNFSPKIDIATLPAHIEALHADWRAIVGGKIGSWDDWRRLAPTIQRFSDLSASLTKRLEIALYELERIAARVRDLDARLSACVDSLQSLSAHPDDRRAFSALRKQAIALRDRLQRIQQGHGLLNDLARRVADFEAGARSVLQDVSYRRLGECQKHAATLAEHMNALEEHAALNYDEPLAKARSALTVFRSLALSKSEEVTCLAGDATLLGQIAGDLASQSRSIGQWVNRIDQALTQIERCASESAALEEQRARAAATLLSWIDYSRQDAALVDLRQRCARATTDRRASSSLDLAESRLSRELSAHQDQLEETRDQLELFTRIQDLKHEESAKYDSLHAALGDASPELLRLYDHRNPGPFANMDAADAETHFTEVIAEIDSELARHTTKTGGSASEAADAKLQRTLAQLQRMCGKRHFRRHAAT